MSDDVLIAAIGAGCTILMQLLNMIKIREVGKTTAQTQETIHVLEKNTNSIKDALIKTTADAKYAEGLKAGKEQAGI